MSSLKDRLVVILGGSSGIGLATAKAARDEGAQVVITGRSTERLAAAKRNLGEEVRTFAVDSADEDGIKRLFAELGPVDHVLCAAGAPVAAKRLQVDTAVIREAFDIRLMGDIYVAKYAAPTMRPNGSITFVAGVAAARPYEGSPVTTAGCAAVEGLARSLAIDLAPLRVNALRPGYVDTPLWDRVAGAQREEYIAKIAKKLLVGRIGRPEELADAALFLMKNGYVTGTTLTIDGGFLLV